MRTYRNFFCSKNPKKITKITHSLVVITNLLVEFRSLENANKYAMHSKSDIFHEFIVYLFI